MIVYEVNTDKKTIIARFDGGKDYWRYSLHEMCEKIIGAYEVRTWDIINEVVDRQVNLVGKAKCHPDDEWNTKKGELIARERLLDKWTHVKRSVLLTLHKRMTKEYDRVQEQLFKRLKTKQ